MLDSVSARKVMEGAHICRMRRLPICLGLAQHWMGPATDTSALTGFHCKEIALTASRRIVSKTNVSRGSDLVQLYMVCCSQVCIRARRVHLSRERVSSRHLYRSLRPRSLRPLPLDTSSGHLLQKRRCQQTTMYSQTSLSSSITCVLLTLCCVVNARG